MRTGVISLGDFTITAAGTQTGDWVEDFDGVVALCAQLRLAYGAGGTTIRAYLQTSLDGGTTIIDVACVLFTTASEVAVFNFSAMTPKTSQITPTDAALADDSTIDGIVGDRYRIKTVSTGLYSGSTVLSARVNPR